MKKIASAAAVVALLMTGCTGQEEEAPIADSDSSQSFAAEGSEIPVDREVYRIRGEVAAEVNELTRQVEPAKGSMSGSLYGGGYGSMSGSFTGPIQAGKSFVRILVYSAEPSTDLAPVGDVTIIKTSDTKAAALVNGDVVEFACRRQYENVAAVVKNEKFNKDKLATWELDYCRLSSPVINVKK